MSPRAIVTRPQPDAETWVDKLRIQNIPAFALPLIAIAPRVRARQGRPVACYGAAMFASSAAAKAFFAASPEAAHWPPSTRAWATGPATAAALAELGVPPALIDAPTKELGLDSEGLWKVVAPQAASRFQVLVVMGGGRDGAPSGRGLISARLRALGASADELPIYARLLPAWTPEQELAAQAALRDGSVWTLTSAESASNLAELLPGADFSRARAAASHPRVADAAIALGFGEVAQCASALYPDMEAALQAMLAPARKAG
jgi:uroporphyrinogen-III synthase